MGFDRRLINVLLLGFAFMLVFTAFQTMGNIQQTIIASIKEEDPDYEGASGYVSLSIIYAVMSILNWSAPSVISVVGPNVAMIIGAVTYLLFIMNFLLPLTWLLYLASVIIGCGAAVIWTGQGNYLTLCSTPATMTRNSGIFWALLQMSLFIGNIIVFFQFKGQDKIEKDSRTTLLWILSGIAVAGIVVMVLLPRPKKQSQEEPSTITVPEGAVVVIELGPVDALKEAVRLFFTRRMLLLCVTFFYTGLELGFFSGVYSSALGFTQNFPNSKEMVGLSGILIGLGEVIGGLLFGIFGTKLSRFGRDPIVILGFIIHVISFFLIFINLPNTSPFGDTFDTAFITSSKAIGLVCSFFLGFGDACYNTQIYSILGSVFADNSASAFAIFKFTQSVAAAICFGYATTLVLYGQLGILLAFGIIGTVTFVMVEWKVKRENAQVYSDSASSSDGSS